MNILVHLKHGTYVKYKVKSCEEVTAEALCNVLSGDNTFLVFEDLLTNNVVAICIKEISRIYFEKVTK